MLAPPIAERIPHQVVLGLAEDASQLRGFDEKALMNPPMIIEDDLYWLRDDDRKNESIINLLDAENRYTSQQLHHIEASTETLFTEFRSRIKESDSNPPYRKGPFLYRTRTEQDKSYPIHCRSLASNEHTEEIILDENEVANTHDMCDVSTLSMSRDHSVLAYSVDFSGLEEFTIKFKSLGFKVTDGGVSANDPLEITDEITGTNGAVEWSSDGLFIFYLSLDEQHRPSQVGIGRPFFFSFFFSKISLFPALDACSWSPAGS